MRRRNILVGGAIVLGAVVIGALTLLFKDFVREAIVLPFSYTFASARGVVERLPQPLIWYVFIGVTVVLAIGILATTTQGARRFREPAPQHRGRVERWMRWIEMASDGEATYAWQYLALQLRDLTLGVLAERELLTHDEVERRLRDRTLSLPPDVERQVATLLSVDATGRIADNGQGMKRTRDEGRIDLERIVQFLEEHTEVRGDG